MNKLTIAVLLLAMSSSVSAKVTSPLFGKPVRVDGSTVEQVSTATTEPASDEGIEDECPSCGFDNEALLSMDPSDIAKMFKIEEDKARAVQVFWKELPKDLSKEKWDGNDLYLNTSNGKYQIHVDPGVSTWTHWKGKNEPYLFTCDKQKASLVPGGEEVAFSPICAFYNGPSDN